MTHVRSDAEPGTTLGAETPPVPRTSKTHRVRAMMVDVAPALGYTLVYATTHQIGLAVGVALTVGALVLIARLVRRQPPWRALSALALVGIGATLAGHSGDATTYFLPHMAVQVGSLVLMAVLMVVRLPPAGVMASMLLNEGVAWRRCQQRRRAYMRASLALLAWPILMSAVNIPLFLAGNVIGLGVMDILNPFLFALAALVAWRIHAVAIRGHVCAHPSPRPVGAPQATR